MLLTTNPRLINTTFTPARRSSGSIEFARPRNANLLMLYAETPGDAAQPATLLTITTVPFVFSISGSAA